jgi:hypothetical protein
MDSQQSLEDDPQKGRPGVVCEETTAHVEKIIVEECRWKFYKLPKLSTCLLAYTMPFSILTLTCIMCVCMGASHSKKMSKISVKNDLSLGVK